MTYTIGMDPSSRKLAIVVLREGRIIHSEWRPLPEDKSQLLLRAFQYTQMLCKKWGIKSDAANTDLHFAIEEPVVGVAGAYATIIQSKVHGACVAGAMASGYVESVLAVQNTTWKKFVLGSGNFPKASIGAWMESNWAQAARLCKTPDEYDAACIAQYAHGLAIKKYPAATKTVRRRKKK